MQQLYAVHFKRAIQVLDTLLSIYIINYYEPTIVVHDNQKF